MKEMNTEEFRFQSASKVVTCFSKNIRELGIFINQVMKDICAKLNWKIWYCTQTGFFTKSLRLFWIFEGTQYLYLNDFVGI